MVNLKIINQKITGKAQQVKGRIEKEMGHPTQGNVDIVKGKINETSANIKMKIDNQHD